MRDIDIRKALHRQVLWEHHADPETLVVDELGLRHGARRVDIAVINGSLHGYELKSDSDTLNRLPYQIETYGMVLDKATLVVGERHASNAIRMLPHWWGVKVAIQGQRNALSFESYRKPRRNGEISAVAVAELLWRVEVINLLASHGVVGTALRRPRAYQYELLSNVLPFGQLRKAVRTCLKARETWRGQTPIL